MKNFRQDDNGLQAREIQPMFRSIFLWSMFGIAIVTLIGCGRPSGEEMDAVDEKSIPVEVTTVRLGDISQVKSYFGNVAAEQSVKVYSKVANQIDEIVVDVGDEVLHGEMLSRVNTDKIHQAVEQAEAGLESAQAQLAMIDAEYSRIKRLFTENAVSQSQTESVKTQWEAARASVKQLEASVSTARSQLADTRIVAPIDGVVAQRLVEEGDMAAPQLPLFELVDMDTVEVSINIIERELPLIQPGLQARIYVDSRPDTVYHGQVERVNPTLNPTTRTTQATIRLPNSGGELKPGMFARVEVIIDHKEHVPLIPRQTVIEKSRLSYQNGRLSSGKVIVDKHVFIVEDGRAFWRPIRTGIEYDNTVEVREGLSGNELIVSVGQHMVTDSAKVNIVTQP